VQAPQVQTPVPQPPKKEKEKKNYDCGFKSLNSGMVCYATKASG
jgi:hypothetical protein